MYEFWYDYVEPKHCGKAKLCTDSFIVYIKTGDIYKDISENVETRPDTKTYELDRPLPKGKKLKSIGVMTNELSGKTMNKSVAPRAKTYIDLIDDCSAEKNPKISRKFVIKGKLENKINHLEKNEIDIESLIKDFKALIKNNKLILKKPPKI